MMMKKTRVEPERRAARRGLNQQAKQMMENWEVRQSAVPAMAGGRRRQSAQKWMCHPPGLQRPCHQSGRCCPCVKLPQCKSSQLWTCRSNSRCAGQEWQKDLVSSETSDITWVGNPVPSMCVLLKIPCM